MKRSPIRFLYYLCYVVSFPILKGLYFFCPGLKERPAYIKFFRYGVTYNAFRIYMEDFKHRDYLSHGVLLCCPVFMLVSILSIILLSLIKGEIP
jgi:prolipoprotein diacylglyceryltransferase